MNRRLPLILGFLYAVSLGNAQTYSTQVISLSSGSPGFASSGCGLPTPDGSEVTFQGVDTLACNEPSSSGNGSGVTWSPEVDFGSYNDYGACISQQIYQPFAAATLTGISAYVSIINVTAFPQIICIEGFCAGGGYVANYVYGGTGGAVACDNKVVIVQNITCDSNIGGSCCGGGTTQCDGSCAGITDFSLPGCGSGDGGCSTGSCQNDNDCAYGQGCVDSCCEEGQGDGNGSTDPACADSCYAGTQEYGTINCIDIVCGDIMNSCTTNCNADCTCADDEDPIVVDLTGNGYLMTNVQSGVKFDILDNGIPVQMAWPAAGNSVGFLVLDRNGNGKIDNGAELFSNVAPQAPPDVAKNGFRALAVYDQPANGGNKDGWIDVKDAIYTKLAIWVDKNHNGVTDLGELMTLQQAGIKAISVAYRPNKWTDANGNQFRYSSNIIWNTGKTEEIYDVFLVTAKNLISAEK